MKVRWPRRRCAVCGRATTFLRGDTCKGCRGQGYKALTLF